MKKKIILLIVFVLIQSGIVRAQHLRVYFKDKGSTTMQITPENVALSTKAVERRQRMGISLDQRDLPVNPEYVDLLRQNNGVIKAKSRWFNYVVVDGLDEAVLRNFSFVKHIEKPKTYQAVFASTQNCSQVQNIDYGLAQGQIEMLRGEKLHELGYLGQGMTIAVLDGGFVGTQSAPEFDSLRTNNRILGTYNFVNSSTDIYTDGSHGSKVFSVLGGYLPNQLVGSAPRANYWLLKSEEEADETPVEMDYWMMAAEFADSVGADIISSSLGYNEFRTGQNHVYADMDGNTTIVTKAADMAAQKGLLVIVSAGNEGNDPWTFITAPADGDSVLAVGAVNSSESRASFSSKGPTADNRIKPDVMALGSSTAFASNGRALLGNGTSFACPIVAGLAACLWQVNPTKSNMDIFNEIRQSGNRSFNPDNEYGYGIPNFEYAFYQIGLDEIMEDLEVNIFPNPVEDELHINLDAYSLIQKVKVELYDMLGNQVYSGQLQLNEGNASIKFPYSSGLYILNLTIEDQLVSKRILK